MDSSSLNLLIALIADGNTNIIKTDRVEETLLVDIYNLLQNNAPPDLSHIFYELKDRLGKFSLSVNNELGFKKIVVVAGSYSSGKTSFINCVLEKNFLPTDINPATAVPTYIYKSDKTKAYGINLYNNKVDLSAKDLKTITHVYSGEESIKISHLLRDLILETQPFPFNHIAFLDTPGYSKTSIGNFDYSDEKKSKVLYDSSDLLIWFVSIETGVITNDDINVLLGMKKDIPKLIVLSKADKLTPNEVKRVKLYIKKTLDEKAINYIDVLCFSKRRPREFDFEKILDIIRGFDSETGYGGMVGFDLLFDRIKNYYVNQILNESKRLYRLNNAITMIEDEEVLNNLVILSGEIRENIKNLNYINETFNTLIREFFYEIRLVLEKANIPIDDFIKQGDYNTFNIMSLIKSYKDKHRLKNSFEITKILYGTYRDIKEIRYNKNIDNYKTESSNIINEGLMDVNLFDKSGFENVNFRKQASFLFNDIFEGTE